MAEPNVEYDLIVIGTGPGGYIAAIRAAQLGMKVATIEDDRPGGICLNWGCIPSKAILNSAELYATAKQGATYGLTFDNLGFDYDRVITQSRNASDKLSKGVSFLFRKNKIDHHPGRGVLAGPQEVVVSGGNGNGKGETRLRGKRILIAVGTTEVVFPGVEVDGERVLTSRQALEYRRVPESMVIAGGGAVGMEFAYIYHSYGCRVTVLEMMDHVLPFVDEECAIELERIYRKQGMELLTGTKYVSHEILDRGVRVAIETPKGKETRDADVLFLAVGRKPVTDGMNLETVGVATDRRGFIVVDKAFRTSVESIYAIGDVIGGQLLAHTASEEGICAVEMMAGIRQRPVDYLKIPLVVYCQPEVASIGLTEKGAREAGYELKVGRMPFSAIGKAVAVSHTEGFVKIVAEAQYGEIVGCHILGKGATELIAELALARTLEATTSELGATVHAHPTLSEALMEAAHAAEGHALNV
ncbi:MAG: dihydrolipoyl dehydrogenase [Gemmatimonadetes bacterium]|nr:dihydrolipoyl dehydrogenase [Gemmatimonadota bacterium]